MKRRHKHDQDAMDNLVLGLVEEGVVSNGLLLAAVIRYVKDLLLDAGQDRKTRDKRRDEFRLGDIVDTFCRYELGAAKQRLRKAGFIEISKGNRPVLARDLADQDLDTIEDRRIGKIEGQLKSLVRFLHRYGRIEAAGDALRMLAARGESAKVEADQLAEELTITY